MADVASVRRTYFFERLIHEGNIAFWPIRRGHSAGAQAGKAVFSTLSLISVIMTFQAHLNRAEALLTSLPDLRRFGSMRDTYFQRRTQRAARDWACLQAGASIRRHDRSTCKWKRPACAEVT